MHIPIQLSRLFGKSVYKFFLPPQRTQSTQREEHCPHYPDGQSQASERQFFSKIYEKCGLDEYNRRYAVNHEKIGIGRTFVLLNENVVIGYYTLSAAQISVEDLIHAPAPTNSFSIGAASLAAA